MVPMDEKIEKRFTNVSASKTFGNIVAHFGLKEVKVLDIGCSYGEFLVHFGEGSVVVSIEKEEVAYVQKGDWISDLETSSPTNLCWKNNLM